MSDCEQCAALRAEIERLKADITYADKHAAKVEDLLWGTAKENEKLKALTVKADEAIERQQQDLEKAADQAADCDILRAEVKRMKEQLESPFVDGYETAKEEYRPRLIAAEAEVERLTAERDRQYDQNAEQITRIAALEAENEKLRATLELFACDCIDSGNLCPSPQNCRNYIARAAITKGEWEE